MENSLLEVVKHADLHCMEEVRLREVAHNISNMSKPGEFPVNVVRRDLGIGCLSVGFAERSITLVIPLGVLPVSREMISRFVLWTLAPNTKMPLEML